MATLRPSVKDLMEVQWARSWDWAVAFPDAPAPFNDWFPATDFDEQVAALDSEQFEGGLSTFKMPANSGVRMCSVSVVEAVGVPLLAWMDSWVNDDILSRGKLNRGIATLEESVREMYVYRLSNLGKPVYQTVYLVYPDGVVSNKGESEGGLVTYEFEFILAGEQDPSNKFTEASNSGILGGLQAALSAALGNLA